jgi:hypothetical protein
VNALLVSFALAACAPSQNNADRIVGTWRSTDGPALEYTFDADRSGAWASADQSGQLTWRPDGDRYVISAGYNRLFAPAQEARLFDDELYIYAGNPTAYRRYLIYERVSP